MISYKWLNILILRVEIGLALGCETSMVTGFGRLCEDT